MKKKMRARNRASNQDGQASGGHIPCIFPHHEAFGDITKEDLIPECNDVIGRVTSIDLAGEAEVTLFI